MAQPVPIFTSPSTTLVQVDSNTIKSPYTPVILNAVAYPGQLVTVLNTLSSLAILNQPIVVSTIAGTTYSDNTFSTLIQQPQGFITAQTTLPNTWNYLNSYPFRDQAISAGVQSLTTSTLVTALISTITDVTSSLVVENLVVTKNFFQSSGLILNTSVSSLGNITILSSLTVNGPTVFSSSVSSIGDTVFGSTFYVEKNFFSRSSLQFASSSLTISTSLSAIGDIVVPGLNRPIQLQGGLIGTSLQVQTSTSLSVDVAGYFLIGKTLSTLSSLTIGGDGFLRDVFVQGSLSTLSSTRINDSVIVDNEALLKKNLFVGGTLALQGDLSLSEVLNNQGNMNIQKNLFVTDNLLTLSTLSTTYLAAESAYIQGNLTVSSGVVSTQNLFINGSLGFQNLTSLSITVGGNTSTLSNLHLANRAFIEGYFLTVGNLSSISSFSVLQDAYSLENISINTSLYVSGGLSVVGKADIVDSLAVNLDQVNPLLSSVFANNFSIVSSISITDTAVLSSIVLASNVLAFNFITSTLTTGYRGITSNVFISTLKTSSIATGGLLNAEQTMDMANVFQTRNLSTFQLSSLLLEVGNSSQPSTSIQFTSSLGIGIDAAPNTFDINADAYTLSNTYINKTLSSAQLFTPSIEGIFKGDGSLLQNINYPAGISSLFLSTGNLIVEKTFLSSLTVSSGVIVDAFFSYSTLQVGDFSLYGNALENIFVNSNNLRAMKNTPNMLALNNMYCYGDSANVTQRQVVVTSNSNLSLSNLYTLGVDGVLRLNDFVSPEFSLYIQTFYGDIVVGVNVGSLTTNTLYVSSGSMGFNNDNFFIPEGYSYTSLSTNLIQPYLSSLVFNSTLFVNRDLDSVGINTKPFYSLDVKGEVFSQKGLLVTESTFVQSYLNLNQQQSSFWLAVASDNTTSNILYSADEGESWSYFTPSNPLQGFTLLNVATSGGALSLSSSNTLQGDKLWIVTGSPSAQYYREGANSWNIITTLTRFPESNACVAYNGRLWVLTGYNPYNYSPSVYPTLHWSEDGITWQPAVSGGYLSNTPSILAPPYGGRSVAWNGSLWVTVGLGNSLLNSILYSGDGKNWSNANQGGFVNGGYGVVWTGCNWVATGDNGSPLSSFCVSADGSNWTGIGGYGFNGFSSDTQHGQAIATNGSLVVAVGWYRSSFSTQSIQYSEDYGYSWCNASGTLFQGGELGDAGLSVTYNGNYWLAGGYSGVRKSYDGKTWYKPSGSLTSGVFQGLAYSSNAQPVLQIGPSNYTSSFTSTIQTINVACGNGSGLNALRYSLDGINWSNAISGYFQNVGNAVAYNGSNRWVVFGDGGGGTESNIIYSDDGKNWLNAIPTDTTATGTSVAYGGGYWVGTLIGFLSNIIYSENGINWSNATAGTTFTSWGYGIAYGNGRYTAVGYGTDTILYAQTLSPPDTWSATGITNAFDTIGYGIAYGNSLWVACGQDSGGYTIKYSGDQLNWSNSSGVFLVNGYGVDYNGSNLWVAVGQGLTTSNILYSGDAITWSNIVSGDFDNAGRTVKYNPSLGLWIAGGSDGGGYTMKYSGDGSNWSNATGSLLLQCYGMAVSGSVVSTQTSYINQLRVYNTPGFGVTTRDTIPTIAYTSTSIQYMNTMTLDRFKTVSIRQQSPNYVSSLYDNSLAMVSTFVSSAATQVAGYFLTTALV